MPSVPNMQLTNPTIKYLNQTDLFKVFRHNSNLHVLNFVARANFNCAGYDILDHEYVNEHSENSDAARQEIYVFHVRILIIVHY